MKTIKREAQNFLNALFFRKTVKMVRKREESVRKTYIYEKEELIGDDGSLANVRLAQSAVGNWTECRPATDGRVSDLLSQSGLHITPRASRIYAFSFNFTRAILDQTVDHLIIFPPPSSFFPPRLPVLNGRENEHRKSRPMKVISKIPGNMLWGHWTNVRS